MKLEAVLRSALAALLLACAGIAHAQYTLEILSLRHRSAEQVLPALRPLVEPGGTLGGQGSQLLVRTSPGNLAELRRALEAIDQPVRRLEVSVRFDDAFDASRRSLGASGRIGDGSRVEIRAGESASSGAERVDQRIQVLEGGHAMIYTGQSQPVRERRYIQTPGGVVSQEVTVLHDTRAGFEIVPRLAGASVQIDIVSAHGYTSASGPLGQWFELATVAMGASRSDRSLAAQSQSSTSETRRVWIKVDALP